MQLEEHPFFAFFPPEEAARLQRHAIRIELAPDTILFSEGAESDCLFLLLEGDILLMKSSGGRSFALATVGAGDFFGELGLLDGSPRSTAARSAGPCRLARIDASLFFEAVNQAPAATLRALMSRVGSSIRQTNERLLTETMRKEKLTLIGEMANTIIHDLRGPFSVIALASEMLARHHPDPESVRFCGMIDRQIGSVTGMVEEILEFARGTPKLHLQPVRIFHLLESFAHTFGPSLEQRGVSLTLDGADAVVRGDPAKLQRVLQNLCTNAADAMGKDGGVITITVAIITGVVEIRVADNGPGIPEAVRANLFEPFVTHGKAKGTGLGLSIARSVVIAHGGEIRFTTETGRGTTFTIELPLAPEGATCPTGP